jgi:hypothetical protein
LLWLLLMREKEMVGDEALGELVTGFQHFRGLVAPCIQEHRRQ